jgi:hypothetical protein
LSGGAGTDLLDVGAGNDDLLGRGDIEPRDIDRIFGRDGDRTIDSTKRSKDGGEDVDFKNFVSCGAGEDTVKADELDVIGEGCENVTFER